MKDPFYNNALIKTISKQHPSLIFETILGNELAVLTKDIDGNKKELWFSYNSDLQYITFLNKSDHYEDVIFAGRVCEFIDDLINNRY